MRSDGCNAVACTGHCLPITVTPISRPVVKRQSNFFGSASRQFLSLVASSCCVRIAPVSSVDGCVRMTDGAG